MAIVQSAKDAAYAASSRLAEASVQALAAARELWVRRKPSTLVGWTVRESCGWAGTPLPGVNGAADAAARRRRCPTDGACLRRSRSAAVLRRGGADGSRCRQFCPGRGLGHAHRVVLGRSGGVRLLWCVPAAGSALVERRLLEERLLERPPPPPERCSECWPGKDLQTAPALAPRRLMQCLSRRWPCCW